MKLYSSLIAVLALGVLAGSAPANTGLDLKVRMQDGFSAGQKIPAWELRFTKLGQAPSWDEVPLPAYRVKKAHRVRVAHWATRRTAHAVPAVQVQGFNFFSGFGDFDPGSFAIGQLSGMFPAPNNPAGMLGGNVINSAAQALYTAGVIALKEDREAGNGEMCFLFDALFNPTPIPILRKPCEEFYAKHDLCKEKWMRNYPGLQGYEIGNQLNQVPLETREAWYDEDYCGAKPRHEYDALRAVAGKKPRARIARK